MKLYKIKRPGGVFSFDVEAIAEDPAGVWLHLPLGSPCEAPHDAGALPFDVLVLLNPDRCWVAWWVGDPADRRLEIDVCLPPERVEDGWSFVDLELDPIRHEGGIIEIEDRDEFETACRDGWIAAPDAEMAQATAIALEAALHTREEPLGESGWLKLEALRAG